MKATPLFISSFLLGLLIAGVYLLAHNQMGNRFAPLIIPTNIATSSMKDVEIVRFNTEGTPQEHLSMDAWRYYPDTATTIINKPELTLYHNNLPIWKIAAFEGIGYHSETHRIGTITLQQDVRLFRFSGTDKPSWQLDTEVLHLSQKEAKTDALVTLIGPGKTIVQTKGAWADLNTGDIKLLSKVKGQYDVGNL